MQSTAPTRIIKKNKVAVAGKISLDGGAVEGTAGTGSGPAGGRKATAKIIETTEAYVTIEVTCGCGTKSYIQCNYMR